MTVCVHIFCKINFKALEMFSAYYITWDKIHKLMEENSFSHQQSKIPDMFLHYRYSLKSKGSYYVSNKFQNKPNLLLKNFS